MWGPALDNIQRLVKRSPVVDEAELESARNRVLSRLAAVQDPGRPGATGAPEIPADVTSADLVVDDRTPDKVSDTGAETEVEVVRTDDQPTEGAPQTLPVRWRLGDDPTDVLDTAATHDPSADPEEDLTPLTMFLGTRRQDAGGSVVDPAGERSPQPGLFTLDPEIGTPAADLPQPGSVESEGHDATQSEAATAAQPVEELASAAATKTASRADDPVGASVAPSDEPGDRTAVVPTPVVEAPAYCPYCATTLKPPPKTTRQCTQCRQRIMVRHVDGRTVYLAEAALPVFDAERRRIAAERRWAALRSYWLELARKSGAPADRIARSAAEPPSEGKVAAARSLYLATVDQSFEMAARSDRWEDAARIRYDESVILFEFAGSAARELPEVKPTPSDPPKPRPARARGTRKAKR